MIPTKKNILIKYEISELKAKKFINDLNLYYNNQIPIIKN